MSAALASRTSSSYMYVIGRRLHGQSSPRRPSLRANDVHWRSSALSGILWRAFGLQQRQLKSETPNHGAHSNHSQRGSGTRGCPAACLLYAAPSRPLRPCHHGASLDGCLSRLNINAALPSRSILVSVIAAHGRCGHTPAASTLPRERCSLYHATRSPSTSSSHRTATAASQPPGTTT